MSYWIVWKSVIHVRSTKPWWTYSNLKKKIVTMYSCVARPPVAQYFVTSMITTVIIINVKDRVTPGSPRTELTRWCANVEWLPIVFDSIRNKLWQNVFAMRSTPQPVVVFQTEQGITIHIGRDRCLFQVRVGPAVKKENRKRCDGCVRKKYSRKPREGNFRRYRQMQVRNFTIRPFKHWWKHRRFIPFLHMEMPKPVS